jgi:hypothetical protein
MPIWQALTFAVFFACCAAQFWFMARVRNALIDRHPEFYLAIERSSIFPRRGLSSFIQSRKHRELGDPELSKAVLQCRWLYVVAICAWLVLVADTFFDH